MIGRAIRILVAIWRGPETRALATEASWLIHTREGRSNHDIDNLVRSVPIALRTLQQEQRRLALSCAENENESIKQGAAIKKLNEIMSDTTSISRQLSELNSHIQQLRQRQEFVREEMMYEIRFGKPTNIGANTVATARVKSKEKLDEAIRTSLRLNLGSGHIPLDGYINVDKRDLPAVDVVSDMENLPFGPAAATEIHSAHFLEHFSQEELRRKILPILVDILKPGGKFSGVVPDADAMITAYSEGRMSYSDLRLVTFGAQEYDGDYHFNMFNPEQLSALLSEAGLKDFAIVERARKNGACLEMQFEAIKA